MAGPPPIYTTEVTVEKLDPPTTLAGATAEVANVARQYATDVLTGVKTFVQVLDRQLEWGVLLADKIADAEKAQTAYVAEVAAKTAQLDQEVKDLKAL
jgi:cell division protein FtsB